MTLPLGAPTRLLGGPLREALGRAAEFGADGVELDARHEARPGDFPPTALRQLRKLLDDHRLRVAALVLPTRGGLDEAEGLERRVLALREAMTFAYQLGARIVVHHAPHLPSPETDAARDATLVESLTLLAAHGDRVGARLAVASGAALDRQEGLFARLPEGVIGAALDPAALVAGGEAPVDAATRLGERVLYVYASDAVRDPAAGERGVTLVEVGRGSADLPALLGALAQRDYRDWIIARGASAAQVENALAYLRKVAE